MSLIDMMKNLKLVPIYISDYFEHDFDYELMTLHLIKYLDKHKKVTNNDMNSSIKSHLSLITDSMIQKIQNDINDEEFDGIIEYLNKVTKSNVKNWCIEYIKEYL